MTQYGGYIVIVNGLRAGLALTIFLSAVQGVNEFYVNPVDAGGCPCHGCKLRYEYLYVLSETGVYACAEDTRVHQCLCQRIGICVAAKESRQIVYKKRIYLETLQG